MMAYLFLGTFSGNRGLVGVLDPHVPVRGGDEDDFNHEDDDAVPPSFPVGAEDRGHGQGEDGHELNENVQRRARGILERVTDSVTNNARLVRVGLLATIGVFVFDVLLGVIPSTTGVGHHHRKHETRGDGATEETTEALGTNQETNGDRGHDSQDARDQHFVDGRLGAHLHARHVVALDTFLAFEETRDVTELALDFDDNSAGSLAHGEHGEGSEQERQHGTENDTGEHIGIGEGHGGGQATRVDTGTIHACVRDILDVRVHQRKRGQDGGANGETLTGGGSGVTEGVELVGALANFVGDTCGHFGDTTGVVRNRTVRISGESDTKGRQHTDGGDGDTVQTRSTGTRDVVARQHGGADDDRRREDRNHTDTQTLDDDSRSTASGTGVGDGLHRGVGVGRAVLGGFTNQDTSDETDDDAAKVSVTNLGTFEEHFNARNGEDNHKDGGRVHTTVECVEKFRLRSVILGGDGPETNGRGEDTKARDPERQRQFTVVRGESSASNDGANEGFEKIGTHTGDITDVVTDVVGNRGGVARVIFRNVRLNLTDEVSADVGSLGVDTTSHTREESDGGSTETEAR
mmetsp:Transcript_6763/g.22192  ORF Transcript_6763/g.22192 Transcript_6763/m.22192 type:complete len:577 (+) Transcript_6763:629-2359(+)